MQLNRLFEIVYILLEEKTLTARKLAARFEVSIRTIYRDVEMLSGAGIPIYMSRGKGGGISLLPGFVLNKAVLTQEEKADVLSSLKALQAVDPSRTESALNKLSSLLGKADTDWIEVDFTSWYNPKKEAERFYALKNAILGKRIIVFSYTSGKGERLERRVEPYKLYFKGQAWYLYGYCLLRQDFRFFKLRRLRELTILDETFTPRVLPLMDTGDFDEEMLTLELRISSEMAFRVYDEFDTFERLEDGSFTVSLNMPHKGWLYQYIASFGQYCEVLAPQYVREEIAKRLRLTLNNYL